MKRDPYFTSYCNHLHDARTGKPIKHECDTIPPAAIKAEREGNTDLANDILHEHLYGKGKRKR